MSEGFWPNFHQINISHGRPCSVWIVNLLTWQKAPEGGYDEKSWEMACNWLMMTSSGDDNRPSGSLGLLTDKTKKKINKINRRQSKKPPSLQLRSLIKGSKALWAAHGWIAQSQVYFCLCGKTSLCAKLLVWKYMSPVRSFTWKSSHFHVKRLAQALVLKKQTAT